jgi:hypothetical protein
MSDYYPNATETCMQSVDLECGLQEACPSCGKCQEQQISFVDCLNAELCNPISCPTTPPGDCPDEEYAYWRCVAEANQGDSTACRGCRADFFPDSIDTCGEVQYLACNVHDACPMCGRCEEQELAWDNCLNQEYCDPFNCSSS